MAVYMVVFYKSLIFKTSKNKFYPTFQFAIFLNTISKLDCKTVGFSSKLVKRAIRVLHVQSARAHRSSLNITSSFLREVLQIQPNHCFYLCAILRFQGRRHHNITLHLLILSWGKHKLESKSESCCSKTSSSFFRWLLLPTLVHVGL